MQWQFVKLGRRIKGLVSYRLSVEFSGWPLFGSRDKLADLFCGLGARGRESEIQDIARTDSMPLAQKLGPYCKVLPPIEAYAQWTVVLAVLSPTTSTLVSVPRVSPGSRKAGIPIFVSMMSAVILRATLERDQGRH